MDGAEAPVVQAELSVFGLIFLIEDSRTQARYISTQLGYFGYQVEIFANMGDALSALSQYTPAVVLTDINLPEGIDAGLKHVPQIKKLTRGDPPFVVALSTLTDFETRRKAVQVGIDGYYVKPVNVPQLVEHLDRLIRPNPEEPLRVLVVEPTEAVAEVYARALNAVGLSATVVSDARRVLDTMAETQPDVVLCRNQLPQCTGFELAGIIRQVDANVGVPVVFLAGEREQVPTQVDVLRAGGDEFLPRGTDAKTIVDVARARATRARAMSRHLLRDSMTGLLKHAALKEAIHREIVRSRRHHVPFCYAMIDIDRFKSINDSQGHAVGDRVIITIARLLSQNLRLGDVVGRYGGEEFGVILPETDAEHGLAILNALRERFSKVNHVGASNNLFQATFSAGLSVFPTYTEVQALVESADAALYEAKHGGRNQVRLAAME